MIVSIAAAVVCLSGYGQPVMTSEQQNSKGYALVFTQSPEGSFEVFYKDPGQVWEDIPAVYSAAQTKQDNPWLVFHLASLDVDYAVRVGLAAQKPPMADGYATSDFSSYFPCEGSAKIDALNNFGLHDIY